MLRTTSLGRITYTCASPFQARTYRWNLRPPTKFQTLKLYSFVNWKIMHGLYNYEHSAIIKIVWYIFTFITFVCLKSMLTTWTFNNLHCCREACWKQKNKTNEIESMTKDNMSGSDCSFNMTDQSFKINDTEISMNIAEKNEPTNQEQYMDNKNSINLKQEAHRP